MKKLLNILLSIGILVAISSTVMAQEELKGSLTLSGAWAVYPTAVAWAEAFKSKHPGVNIDITAGGAGKGAADAIAGLVDIGMVSREPDPSETTRIKPYVILKDAVFAVISNKNPLRDELLAKGASRDVLKNIYITGLTNKWDQITGTKGNKPIHVYTRSDSAGAASSWAAFLGKKQDDLKGIGIYGDPGLLETVKRDPVGIGYNNFSYVFDKSGKVIAGVHLLPIDANNNGKVDGQEAITDRNQAVDVIQAGKYPAGRKNYFYLKDTNNALVKAFIAFALSDEGTQVVDQVGASLPLTKPEREAVLKSLN